MRTKLFIDALPLTTARTSGIGHMLAAIVHELARRPEVQEHYEIVLFGPAAGRERAMSFDFPNVSYRALPFPKKVTTLLNFVHLLPAVDRLLGPGVYLFGNFVNYPLTSRSVSLTYVHDLCYLRHPEFLRPKVLRHLKRHLLGWMLRTDAVITVSDDAHADIATFYPYLADKTATVLNGVDLTHFRRRDQAEIDAVKQKYGVTGNYILYVGNIEPRKNLERLIHAFQKLPVEYQKDHSLVLAGGDGWLNENIHAAMQAAVAAGWKVMKPQGYVSDEDLPALFSGATVSALVSVHEGFGMPLIESMACGVPVVAGDIPSLREVVGEAGVYVDPLDEAAIAAGLTSFLANPAKRQDFAAFGLQQVQQFTWQKSADSLLQAVDAATQRHQQAAEPRK